MLSKPMKFYFIDDNDLDVRVKHKSIKEISTKKLVFGASSIKLRTILQILQKFDSLTWEKQPTVANTVQEQKQGANGQKLQQNEPIDKNPDIKL